MEDVIGQLKPAQRRQLDAYKNNGLDAYGYGPDGSRAALHQEACAPDVVMCDALLRAGASVDLPTKCDDRRTALELLAFHADSVEDPELLGRVREMVRLLRDNGAERPKALQELLDAFERTGRRMLLDIGHDLCVNLQPCPEACLATATSPATSPEDRDWAWRTRFLLAAEIGDDIELCRLVVAGVNVRARDNYGYTALHVAAASGHVGAVEMLLNLEQTRMLITAVTARGETAYDLADRGCKVVAADPELLDGNFGDKFKAICELLRKR